MRDTLGRVIPRPPSEFHPRVIRQLLDPFKPLAYARQTVLFNKKLDELRSKKSPLQCEERCKGYFWDNEQMRMVCVDFGIVWIKPVISYRAASSADSFDDEPANLLSWAEGAARYETFSAVEQRPQRGTSEDAAQTAEKKSGSYVIPGQSLTDWTNHAD